MAESKCARRSKGEVVDRHFLLKCSAPLLIAVSISCQNSTNRSAADLAPGATRDAATSKAITVTDLAALDPAPTAAKQAAGVNAFVTWLEQHPEVTLASLSHDNPIARARYSDSSGTVACGAKDGRALCVRDPAQVRHMWTLSYRRRDDGRPALTVGLGPLPGDEEHAKAYEFRFPEATAHLRGPYVLQGTPPNQTTPSWAMELHEFHPVPPTAPPAAARTSPLPSVTAPNWVTDESFSVGIVEAEPNPILNIGGKNGEDGTVFCHHQLIGWQCFSPVPLPSLSELEPKLRPGDRRVKQVPPWPMRATVSCTPDETCSLFVEWEWERILIAHSYWAEGSFVTLYQAKSGHEPHLMGVLRTGTSTRGFAERSLVLPRTQAGGLQLRRAEGGVHTDQDPTTCRNGDAFTTGSLLCRPKRFCADGFPQRR